MGCNGRGGLVSVDGSFCRISWPVLGAWLSPTAWAADCQSRTMADCRAPWQIAVLETHTLVANCRSLADCRALMGNSRTSLNDPKIIPQAEPICG